MKAFGNLTALRRRIANSQWKGLSYEIFVRKHGLDLGFVSVDRLGLIKGRSTGHSNSGGPGLDVVLRTLSITGSDSILDIGCGKGGAMITLDKYPFARVDGLDISPELVRIAEENLRRLNVPRAQVFCSSAEQFREYDAYNYIYMFNPFSAEVMQEVIANIAASLQTHPRELTIIYSNPLCDEVLMSTGLFTMHADFNHVPNMPIRVYRT